MFFSFDRVGYARHRAGFSNDPERSLRGRRVLITGGTDGIGLAAARALAARGADVRLWGRSREKGERAASLTGGTFTAVDLGDLDAVRDAARALEGPVDSVLLNAGAMPLQRQLTPQGHELVWGSQVLGHLLVCRLLRGSGQLAAGGRVIWVSSGGMYLAKLDLSDLRRERGYPRHGVYANAKRAQVELAAHLAGEWPELVLASMHPGWVETDAVRASMPWFHAFTRPILRTPEQGADTLVWLVARERPVESGRFWFDRRAVPEHRFAWTRTTPEARRALIDAVFTATDDREGRCAG